MRAPAQKPTAARHASLATASLPPRGHVRDVSSIRHLQSSFGNQAVQWSLHAQLHARTAGTLQAKLTINQPGDQYEQEADRVAEQVMRMGEPDIAHSVPPAIQRLESGTQDRSTAKSVQRLCAECEGEEGEEEEKTDEKTDEKTVQADADVGFSGGGEAPASVHATLRNEGRPLDLGARAFFEPRFGHDFSNVRVHTDGAAAASAADIAARSYTVGEHIVFADGTYAPHTESGQRLLAHELTHVIQQRSAEPHVSRDVYDDAKKALGDLKEKAQEVALQQLRDLGDKPLGPPSGYTNKDCPPNFCQPFVDKKQALLDLAWAGPLMLAGIAIKVNPRVVPFWAAHIAGGAAPQNISSGFAADFTSSGTTADTTTFLMSELRAHVLANHATLMGAAPSVTVDFTPLLASALAELDDQNSGHPMDFNVIGEIPGNLAGGIGKDEAAIKIGARPSPFNDARGATISATLTRQPNGDILVTPTINFVVQDTVDLCPGNCGLSVEQAATIPLSRFEATGLSGDVPFTVNFPAPAKESAPFTVTPAPAPAPPAFPKTGKARTTVKNLRVRSGPGLKFPVVNVLGASGTALNVKSQAHAETINGNDVWDQVDGGWVSDAYVAF